MGGRREGREEGGGKVDERGEGRENEGVTTSKMCISNS